MALTVIGLAGCVPRAPDSAAPSASFDPLTYVGDLDEIEAFWCSDERRPASPDPPVLGPDAGDADRSTWARIGIPAASAYILVRGGEAAVVDTGPWCTSDVIEGGLAALGLGWFAELVARECIDEATILWTAQGQAFVLTYGPEDSYGLAGRPRDR